MGSLAWEAHHQQRQHQRQHRPQRLLKRLTGDPEFEVAEITRLAFSPVGLLVWLFCFTAWYAYMAFDGSWARGARPRGTRFEAAPRRGGSTLV